MVREPGEQDEALRQMVASLVHEASGTVAQDLCGKLSCHVDSRLKETALSSNAAATSGRYMYETNPYSYSMDTQLRSSALSDLGVQCALTGVQGTRVA